MTRIISLLSLTSLVFALPQAPPAAAPSPAPTPKVIGQLPQGGLRGIPWPGFAELASFLGFDPAKATPVPDSPGTSCVKSANGGFCFGSGEGSSFSVGQGGGSFNGAGWNPFSISGTAGGLSTSAAGSLEDEAA